MYDPGVAMSGVSAGVVPLGPDEPLPSYIWMRPPWDGIVNSETSTPILSSTHSSESTEPVETAVRGMSPSKDVRGMTSWTFAVVVQAGMVTYVTLRQRPSWSTTGMFEPAGTFARGKGRSNAVVVWTSGRP